MGLHTTVLLEAAIRGLPTVSYSPHGYFDWAEYHTYGVAFVERDREGLVERLRSLVRSPQMPEARGDLPRFVRADGRAGARIAERVRWWLNKGR